MAATSTKELALEAIRRLPDGATLEEVVESIHVVLAIEAGLKDVAEGRLVPHEEVVARFLG